jgi:hypothetical protein
MRLRSMTSLLLVAALGVAACGNDDADRVADPGETPSDERVDDDGSADGSDIVLETVSGARGEVLAAAVESTDDGSARMTMTVSMGTMLSYSAEGLLDFESGDSSMSMDMGSLAAMAPGELDADDLIIEMRMVDDQVFMRMPGFMGEVFGAGDDQWIGLDAAAMAGASGLSDAALEQLRQQGDPSAYLTFLRGASDDIEAVGTDDVRGTDTTHYSGTLDMGRALDELPDEVQDLLDEQLGPDGDSAVTQMFAQLGLDEIPFDVWIDDEHRLRKMAIEIDLAEMLDELGAGDEEMPPGFSGAVTMVFEMYDYGVEVDIDAPPADEVHMVDLDDLARASNDAALA